MSEKKEKPLSKTALKKLETQKRLEFLRKVFRTVLGVLVDYSNEKMDRNIDEIRIKQTRYNRYITLHDYLGDLKINIYRDGNIAVEIGTRYEGPFEQQLFNYQGKENPDEFLTGFSDTVKILIENYDDPCYLDYLKSEKDIVKAYEVMCKEVEEEDDEG